MKTMRQGDVLIIKVKNTPANLKEIPRDANRVVLAYGEVTGHAHAIHDSNAWFALNESTLERFLEVKGQGVTLRHEEHSEIQLPAGAYKVVIQKEYHPSAVRNVAD